MLLPALGGEEVSGTLGRSLSSLSPWLLTCKWGPSPGQGGNEARSGNGQKALCELKGRADL